MASYPAPTRPPNSLCADSMPVSRMYAVTPSPVPSTSYVPSSGRFRWSMRSCPQLPATARAPPADFTAGGETEASLFSSTAWTPASPRTCSSCADVSVAAKPCRTLL